MTYVHRPGTSGEGDEYEYLVPALFALRAICRSDVLDAWLATNVDEMGAFDDVVFFVQYENAEKQAYIIQLKHQKAPVTASALASDKKYEDYTIKKYQDSFAKIMENVKNNNDSCNLNILDGIAETNMYFIIYTIASLTNDISKSLTENYGLNLYEECVYRKGHALINTSSNVEASSYKFKTNSQSEYYSEAFLSRFYLYTNQGTIKAVEDLLQKVITEKFGNPDNNIRLNFLNFMKMWGRGELGGHYRLTKQEMQLKLAELLLNPYLVAPKSFNKFKNSHLWNKVVNSAEAVVIENYDPETLSLLWEAVNANFYRYSDRKMKEGASWEALAGIKIEDLPRKYKGSELKSLTLKQVGENREITMKSVYIVLWKAGLLPLLITIEDTNVASNVSAALNLIKSESGPTRRFVLLFKEASAEQLRKFETRATVRTLLDIDNVAIVQEILDHMEISLQQKKPVKLSKLVEKDDDILKDITAQMFLKMLHLPLVVGEKCGGLPGIYVRREIGAVLLKKQVFTAPENVFIVHGKQNVCRELQEITEPWRVADGKAYFTECAAKKNENNPNIIALPNDVSLSTHELHHFVSNKRAVHYLRYYKRQIQWRSSKGHVNDIRPFVKDVQTGPKSSIREENLLSHFLGKTNIISGVPGIGKSVMLKRLAEKCAEEYWIVLINLNRYKDHFSTTKTPTLSHFLNIDFAEALPTCYNTFIRGLLSVLQKRKRVLCLIDGFDEITENSDTVVTFIKSINSKGFPVWITTRPMRSSYLEQELNTVALALNPLTPDDQKVFLKNYFSMKKKCHAETFVKNLQQFLSVVFRQYTQFLSVPLHLNMVVEVFEDMNVESFNGFKEVTSIALYGTFIERKLDIYLKRTLGDGVSRSNRIYKRELDYLSTKHAEAALLVFYSSEMLSEIVDLEELHTFLNETKTGDENIGLIVSVTGSEPTPIFVHKAFAEYLAATFLVRKVRNKEAKQLCECMFDMKFAAVRQFFDTMLAEGRPLHLAVLNNNLAEVQRLMEQRKECSGADFDPIGRTPLHLVAGRGVMHDFPKSNMTKKAHRVPRVTVRTDGDRILKVFALDMEILEKVVTVKEFHEKPDGLCGWTPIDYAVRSRSINMIDALITNTMTAGILDSFDRHALEYICVKHGYGNILKILPLDTYVHVSPRQCHILHVALPHSNCNLNVLQTLLRRYDPKIMSLYLETNDRKSNLPLMLAAINNDVEAFKILLSYKVGVNKKNFYGLDTVLVLAFYNYLECMKILLEENSVDVNTRATRSCDRTFKHLGHTALYFAVNNGSLEMVRLLLQHRADPSLTYENMRTVLHVAAVNDFSACLEELLRNGADIHAKDDCARTPLHYAVLNAKLHSAESLLRLGADVNRNDIFGRTPLHYMVQIFILDRITQLLSSGCDMNAKDGGNATPLHYTCCPMTIKRVRYLQALKQHNNWNFYNVTTNSLIKDKDQVPNIEFLINNGAVADASDNEGRTTLHYAVEKGFVNSIKSLLELGADVNAKDANGQTPLYEAARTANTEAVELILSFSPDVNQSDNFQVAPLHLASGKEKLELAQLLIKHGAKVNSKTADGCTPLFMAAKRNHIGLVELLLMNNANPNKPSCDAFSNGNADCIARKTVPVRVKAVTPFHLAVQNKVASICNLMLDWKAKINQTDSEGWTALHFAAKVGFTECIEKMLKRGADVRLRNAEEQTPIDVAIQHDQHPVLMKLLETKYGKQLKEIDQNVQTYISQKHVSSL